MAATPTLCLAIMNNNSEVPVIDREPKLHLKDVNNSAELMISTARLFDAHSIPYIVWGTSCLSFHGVPTMIMDVAFVVPDMSFDQAASSLLFYHTSVNHCDCHNGLDGRTGLHYASNCTTTVPQSHFIHYACPDVLVELWRHSDVMWNVDIGNASADVVLGSPARKFHRKRKGAEPHFYLDAINVTDNYPVRYLSAACMREVGLLLSIRDVSIPTSIPTWLNYVLYAILYIDNEKLASGFRDDLLQATYDKWLAKMTSFTPFRVVRPLLFPEFGSDRICPP